LASAGRQQVFQFLVDLENFVFDLLRDQVPKADSENTRAQLRETRSD
jgi:hypothetical protein